LSDNPDYQSALDTAGTLLHRLRARPDMPWHEQLAIATYAILDGFDRVRAADPVCPVCGEWDSCEQLATEVSRSAGHNIRIMEGHRS